MTQSPENIASVEVIVVVEGVEISRTKAFLPPQRGAISADTFKALIRTAVLKQIPSLTFAHFDRVVDRIKTRWVKGS